MKWLTRDQWLFCLRAAVAMVLAYFVAHGSDPTNAIYAVLGAGLVTAPSFGEGIGVSKDRLIGTLLGAAVSVPASWLPGPVWSLIAAVAIAGPLGVAIGGPSVARIASTIAAVAIVLHPDSPQYYGFFRFTNTAAGVATALVVSAAFWPISGRRDYPSALSQTLDAGARLAENMAKFDRDESSLEFQRKLFRALSAIPKSTSHARLDPLLRRRWAKMEKEGFLTIKIAIALLSISVTYNRVCENGDIPDEIRALGQVYGHIAQRLRRARAPYVSAGMVLHRTLSVEPVETVPLPTAVGALAKVAPLIAELVAIEQFLDELDELHRLDVPR